MTVKTAKFGGAAQGAMPSPARALGKAATARAAYGFAVEPVVAGGSGGEVRRGDFRPPYGLPPVDPVVTAPPSWGPRHVLAHRRAAAAYIETARRTETYVAAYDMAANDNPRHALDAVA